MSEKTNETMDWEALQVNVDTLNNHIQDVTSNFQSFSTAMTDCITNIKEIAFPGIGWEITDKAATGMDFMTAGKGIYDSFKKKGKLEEDKQTSDQVQKQEQIAQAPEKTAARTVAAGQRTDATPPAFDIRPVVDVLDPRIAKLDAISGELQKLVQMPELPDVQQGKLQDTLSPVQTGKMQQISASGKDGKTQGMPERGTSSEGGKIEADVNRIAVNTVPLKGIYGSTRRMEMLLRNAVVKDAGSGMLPDVVQELKNGKATDATHNLQQFIIKNGDAGMGFMPGGYASRLADDDDDRKQKRRGGASVMMSGLGQMGMMNPAGMVFGVADAIANLTGIADSGLGVITGAVGVVWDVLQNVGLVAMNVFLGVRDVFDTMKQQVIHTVMGLVNDAIYHFYTLKGNFWDVILGMAEALNALPLIDIDLASLQDTVAENRMQADAALQQAEYLRQQNEELTIKDAFMKGFSTHEVFPEGWYREAFAEGAAVGDGWTNQASTLLTGDAGTNRMVWEQEVIMQPQESADVIPAADIAQRLMYDTESLTCTLDDKTLSLLQQMVLREPEEHITNNYTIAMHNTMHVREEADVNKIMRKILDQLWEAADAGSDRVSIRFGR